MALAGWALSLAGCPYLFTTGGLPALSSTSPLWFGGQCTVADGYLVPPRGSFVERAKPLDGDLEVDAIAFDLHDAVVASGPAAGFHLFTHLATRGPLQVTSTPITADLTDATLVFPVADGAALDPFPRTVWIEQEALRVTSRAGNDLTVAVLADRGYHGTKRVAHAIDGSTGRRPEVWKDFPWATRRKAVLWLVETSGTATAVWAGVCQRAPQLHADGATFRLQCDPLWQHLREARVYRPAAQLRIVGAGGPALGPPPDGVAVGSAAIRAEHIIGSAPGHSYTGGIHASMEALLDQWANTDVRVEVDRVVPGATCRADVRRERGRFVVTFDTSVNLSVSGNFFGESISSTGYTRVAGVQSCTVRIPDVPPVSYLVHPAAGTTRFRVNSLRGLPLSWARTAGTVTLTLSSGYQPVLRVAHSEDWWIQLSAVTTVASPAEVRGTTILAPRRWGRVAPEGDLIVKGAGPLHVVYLVDGDHWALALRWGALPLVAETQSETDWDWSGISDLIRSTGSGLGMRRQWAFDGGRTLGEVVAEACLLAGCTPATRDGRLVLVAWQLPRTGETIVAKLGAGDLVGTTSWETWGEGLANTLKLKGDQIRVDVTDERSLNRFGAGRPITIEMAGFDVQQLVALDPADLARALLGRLTLWSEPVARVTVRRPLDDVTAIFLGDTVSLTEWMAPDGAGARGLSGALAKVVARRIDFDAHLLELEALVFPRTAVGYAPCARCATTLPAADTVRLAKFPVRTSEDYAGSVAAGLTDGGQSLFRVGDRVQLIQRDTTSLVTQDLIIAALPAGGGNFDVQFTANVNATLTAAIALGYVDLRYSKYQTAGLQDGQKDYAFVASETTGVIGGTATVAQMIAP